MQRTDSFKKTLMLGKTEDGRRRGDGGWEGWMTSPIWWAWVWAGFWCWWWTGGEAWRAVVRGITESDAPELLNWSLYICLYLNSVDFALLISLWHTSLHFHKYSFHHYLYVVWTFKIIVSCQFTNIFDEFQIVWKIIK